MRKRRRQAAVNADLDITSFMNLMIILVPVLLLNMVFSHITVLDIKLPDLALPEQEQTPDEPNKQLEVLIRDDYLDVNYPAGIQLKRIVNNEQGTHDYGLLSDVLQEVKRQLRERDIDKKDILLLSEADTDYQTLVAVMDVVRSFDAVVAASVVEAELFPQISLGDAPVLVAETVGAEQ